MNYLSTKNYFYCNLSSKRELSFSFHARIREISCKTQLLFSGIFKMTHQKNRKTVYMYYLSKFHCSHVTPVKWILIITHTDSYLKFQRRMKLCRRFAAGLIFKFTNEGAGSKRTGRGVFLRERPRRVQRPASESRSVKWRWCTPVRNVPILPARYYFLFDEISLISFALNR